VTTTRVTSSVRLCRIYPTDYKAKYTGKFTPVSQNNTTREYGNYAQSTFIAPVASYEI
jgi:hypothetical protein